MLWPMFRLALPFLCACAASPGDSGTATNRACDDGGGVDTWVAGLEKITADGATVRLLDAVPTPPDVGPNRFVVEVDGFAGSAIGLRPWMPLHGHGTVPEWHQGSQNGSSWTFEEIDLFMAGLWELTFTIDSDDPTTGAQFRFCLEG